MVACFHEYMMNQIVSLPTRKQRTQNEKSIVNILALGLIDNLHVSLNFDLGKKSEIHYFS